MDAAYYIIPLLVGWFSDFLWGDPHFLPHPVVGFGKMISYAEKLLNNGKLRIIKGGLVTVFLIISVYMPAFYLLKLIAGFNFWLYCMVSSVLVFFCLAGKTLISEVKEVFSASDISVEAGREQVARIVGRDTTRLNPQEIRTAALETLSENLSDGVVAPLFWYLLLGVPGMLAYKMVNTLDSMIGYKNERYKQFGCLAARLDDIANFIPARLTAVWMVLVSGRLSLFAFVGKYGKNHSSPNSGYPEAALAAILNCRFGGPNVYSGKLVTKPYIGDNPKLLTFDDLKTAVSINRKVEVCMVGLLIIIYNLIFYA